MNAERLLIAKRALAAHEREHWLESADLARERIARREAAGDYGHNHRSVTGYGSYLRTGEQVRREDESWLDICERSAAKYPRQVLALRSAEALYRYLGSDGPDGDGDYLSGDAARVVIAALLN